MSGLTIVREQVSLREKVVDALRESILDGTLAPGEKLRERDLCERLGVSRTLLREALQQLLAEDLIVNVLHKGPSVAVISRRDAQEIFELRQILESRVAHGFVEHATDSQIADLEKVMEHLLTQDVKNDPGKLLKTKNEFYAILVNGCGNITLAGILTKLNNRISILRRLSLSQPGRYEEMIAELQEIMAAIKVRDAATVARLSSEHVLKAAEKAIETYDLAPNA